MHRNDKSKQCSFHFFSHRSRVWPLGLGNLPSYEDKIGCLSCPLRLPKVHSTLLLLILNRHLIRVMDIWTSYEIIQHSGGNFNNVIRDIYSNNTSQIRIGRKLTPSFICYLGVKPGDSLSPKLFNMFVFSQEQVG